MISRSDMRMVERAVRRINKHHSKEVKKADTLLPMKMSIFRKEEKLYKRILR